MDGIKNHPNPDDNLEIKFLGALTGQIFPNPTPNHHTEEVYYRAEVLGITADECSSLENAIHFLGQGDPNKYNMYAKSVGMPIIPKNQYEEWVKLNNALPPIPKGRISEYAINKYDSLREFLKTNSL